MPDDLINPNRIRFVKKDRTGIPKRTLLDGGHYSDQRFAQFYLPFIKELCDPRNTGVAKVLLNSAQWRVLLWCLLTYSSRPMPRELTQFHLPGACAHLPKDLRRIASLTGLKSKKVESAVARGEASGIWKRMEGRWSTSVRTYLVLNPSYFWIGTKKARQMALEAWEIPTSAFPFLGVNGDFLRRIFVAMATAAGPGSEPPLYLLPQDLRFLFKVALAKSGRLRRHQLVMKHQGSIRALAKAHGLSHQAMHLQIHRILGWLEHLGRMTPVSIYLDEEDGTFEFELNPHYFWVGGLMYFHQLRLRQLPIDSPARKSVQSRFTEEHLYSLQSRWETRFKQPRSERLVLGNV